MNGLGTKSPTDSNDTTLDLDDLDSLKEYIIPRLLNKVMYTLYMQQ